MTMPNAEEEAEAIEAVAETVSRIEHDGRNAKLTLSNGIVLGVRSVPPLLVSAINESFTEPEVPMVRIEDQDRDEENPNDPAYIKALFDVQTKRELALMDLCMGVGTHVLYVPEGYFAPDDDGWEDILTVMERATGVHIEVSDDKIKRYLAWLRFYALENGDDVTLATTLSMTLAGLREQEVMDALNSFRGLPERRADIDSPASPERINGNRPNRATRRNGAASRGT